MYHMQLVEPVRTLLSFPDAQSVGVGKGCNSELAA